MNSKNTALYEALADAAGSGCELSEEWRERIAVSDELRMVAERFYRSCAIMGELKAMPAPEELRGRVVSTLQAGYREDRAATMLIGLRDQTAPPELEALVAESIPGAVQRTAPPELDERVEALLEDWEKTEAGEQAPLTMMRSRGRAALIGLATAASLLFVVALTTQGQSDHEKQRDSIVAAISTITEGRPTGGTALFAEGLLSGVTGGLSDENLAAIRQLSPTGQTQSRRTSPNRAASASPSSRRPGQGAQSGSQAASAGNSAAAGREGADLLTRLADSGLPPHHGVRRVEIREGADSPFTLIYREELSVDEEGRFAIDPVEVVEPQMSPSKRELFLLMQKTREGFFYRYRDFRIRDLARFLEQYTVTESQYPVFVVNRECVELEIRRTGAQGERRVICVDPET
ncbi:MAG: hypothetical protein OSB14_02110, partial [Planctomycetota bacterium]|nr:hypothetical protein [Planctomycetota bacterium]